MNALGHLLNHHQRAAFFLGLVFTIELAIFFVALRTVLTLAACEEGAARLLFVATF